MNGIIGRPPSPAGQEPEVVAVVVEAETMAAKYLRRPARNHVIEDDDGDGRDDGRRGKFVKLGGQHFGLTEDDAAGGLDAAGDWNAEGQEKRRGICQKTKLDPDEEAVGREG
jgi:hypothetical protein